MSTKLPHGLNEFRFARNHIHIAGYRLHDYTGDVVSVTLKSIFKLRGIVVFENKCVFRYTSGNARRTRVAEREHTGAGFYQKAIAVAVVAALKFNNLIAPRKAACKANGAHARFSARTH